MKISVYKFGVKPKITQPKTIHWCPLKGVKYPPRKVNPVTREIFSQEQIKLTPKQFKEIRSGFEFVMSKRVVLTALINSLKYKGCSLQNEVNSKTLRIAYLP